MKLGIVGGGRAAWAFGSAWASTGGSIAGIALRETSMSSLPALLGAPRVTIDEVVTRASLVLVAVPDDALPSLCARVASLAPESSWLFHASGSHPSSLFAPHARAFSLHPLRSLPKPGSDGALDGALVVVEGPADSHTVAEMIALCARARLAGVTSDAKPTYHAAAVLAANCPAALLSMSEQLLRDAGVEGVGTDDIAALAISAIENWRKNVDSARFTGPVVRGDTEVVRKHLELLSGQPTMRSVYSSIALELCEIILQREPNNPRVRSVQQALLALPLP